MVGSGSLRRVCSSLAPSPRMRVLSAALSDFTRARRVSLVASFSEREGANQCEAIHEAFRSVTLG
jgi:hypothetical protein